MNILQLSWKNILHKPLNSFMSVLLFALSIGLIVFLLLFNYQLRKGLENNLAGIDLVVGAKGSPLQLILNSMYHIDAPTGNVPVQGVTSFLNPKHPLIAAAYPLSLGDSYGGYRIVGTTPSILMLYDAQELRGNIYQEDFEVITGYKVAEALELELGDEFYSTHGLEDNPDLAHDHGEPFRVTGILQKTGTVLDQLILCTPMTVWKVHEHDSTGHEHHHHHDHSELEGEAIVRIDTLHIRTLSDSIVSTLRSFPEKEITSVLLTYKSRTNIHAINLLRNINQNTDLMAASPAYEINRLYAMIGNGGEAIRYLAILIACVAALSIFISLYTSLKERRYEMAIIRVSGAGPAKLWWMILAEGLWISLCGLILGLILGHGAMELAGNIFAESYRYPFTGWLWRPEEIYVVAGALLIGFVASIIPAIEGSRTELHKTLAEN